MNKQSEILNLLAQHIESDEVYVTIRDYIKDITYRNNNYAQSNKELGQELHKTQTKLANKRRNNPHAIGGGEYEVHYVKYEQTPLKVFKGVCENFNPNGTSAFWNKELEQMLLVDFMNIVGMYPINKKEMGNK